jgi:hypothetical protein
MLKRRIIMKRDMDLIRTLLLTIEAGEHGIVAKQIEIPGYTQEQINYHAYLLGEAGLANTNDVTSHGSKSPEALIYSLTWEGHEFIDSIRENNIWNQAKDKISKVGGASLPVWTALLTELIKKAIGI